MPRQRTAATTDVIPGYLSLSLSPFSIQTMGHFGLVMLPPSQAVLPPPPMSMFVASPTMPRHSPPRWSAGYRYRSRPLAERAADSDGKGARSEGQHSEQRAGFRPPAPLEDDGFRVNIADLQDLVDSGEGISAFVYAQCRGRPCCCSYSPPPSARKVCLCK